MATRFISLNQQGPTIVYERDAFPVHPRDRVTLGARLNLPAAQNPRDSGWRYASRGVSALNGHGHGVLVVRAHFEMDYLFLLAASQTGDFLQRFTLEDADVDPPKSRIARRSNQSSVRSNCRRVRHAFNPSADSPLLVIPHDGFRLGCEEEVPPIG
jgi:hypothetical protein